MLIVSFGLIFLRYINVMTSKARQYKPSTVRRLDTFSGNQCASPTCERPLIAHDGETIVSKICHIEAASKKGPRYNADMTDDERRHYDNLILLCDECHSVIDNMENESEYPVELLRQWKTSHENKQRNKLASDYSLLSRVIDLIAEMDLEDETDGEDEAHRAFRIEDKISHNAVKRNRFLIDEYKIFYGKINSLYGELEREGSFKKNKLLSNIKQLYLKVKGSYVGAAEDVMGAIRENADNIIEDIEEMLVASLKNSNKCSNEDVSYGVSVVMVDAFMRCKILEEPPRS